ncbi:MAG: hypothetical protein MRERC_2c025 [Mycoplasmataceae bacterium RC_NB112A]|nr:MAG: hypothetical protein MRERC_6c075 [Mycoplasmataceae bacterium RC_NB112A]KLL02149.1 MAG: hypothetical protein MRERC_4c115 [Mycoplasmataceae bacterium RC_NB112A]KLL02161.1 MAG: hypothetical protein MRERC_4c128 [Mycoplasmataceae bacterium RC_NB112A]KLL02309.1 MAG: hypothetical protein MRERC_2c025 [Mycoplasmataceae bacterium RC_NB112A]
MPEVHPHANSWKTFNELITSPYVIKKDLPYEYRTSSHWEFDGYVGEYVDKIEGVNYTRESSKYLKPLDIVKVNMIEPPYISFYHFGVYLGNNEVCHFALRNSY